MPTHTHTHTQHYKKKQSQFFEEECLSNEICITATGKAHDLATRATHQLKVHTELSHLTIIEKKPRSSIKPATSSNYKNLFLFLLIFVVVLPTVKLIFPKLDGSLPLVDLTPFNMSVNF